MESRSSRYSRSWISVVGHSCGLDSAVPRPGEAGYKQMEQYMDACFRIGDHSGLGQSSLVDYSNTNILSKVAPSGIVRIAMMPNKPRYDQTKHTYKKVAALLLWLLFQVGLMVQLLLISWFLYTVVRDGISDKLMTFESEPSQGWDYWRDQYRNAALRGWAVPMAIAAMAFVALAWLIRSTAHEIRACFTNSDIVKGETGTHTHS